jgi:beta-propeller repeat-containing protein
MFQYALIPSRRKLALFTFLLSLACPLAATADARVSESYGKLPLHFEANQGQADKEVRFLSRGPGYSLYLTAGEAVLVLTRPNPDGKPDGRSTPGRREAPAQAMPAVLRMSIVGAAPAPLVSGREELPGKANYFIGRDPEKWRTNVATYAKVHYREVYPGIDLVYYGNQRQLEYDFVVAPGADPKKIVLGFKGADKLEIDAEGDLVLHMAGEAVRQKKPVIYQEIDGVRQEVAGSYVLKGAKRIGFKVAAYDTSRPLVIDPVVLSYSTYLGGISTDRGRAIAVDSVGNAYVTGYASSSDFPTTPAAFQPIQPSTDSSGAAFVTKLNPTGSALVYSTYLGGNRGAAGGGIAVDADGNAYVTGSTTSRDFPTTPEAFQPSFAGGDLDAFVVKLDPTGSALLYSTYLGGTNSLTEGGSGIAVDVDGNAYVTGVTRSPDFPTTPGAFQSIFGGGYDVFVTKLNRTGSALVYSTFLGGSAFDYQPRVALGVDGSAYVTGVTQSSNFPTTPQVFQPSYGGQGDAFVTKLAPDGSGLVYSTYLGGFGDDGGSDIAVDAAGNAYVTGSTFSFGPGPRFPTTPGAFDTTSGNTYDAFVSKLHPSGSCLVYSTYLGGSDEDRGNAIAVDADGNAFVTGHTRSTDFPTTPGVFQPSIGGVFDTFVTKLNPTGSLLLYSVYLGSMSDDRAFGIAVDAAGNAYVTGMTGDCFNPDCSTNNFPTTPGAFQPNYGGTGDAFVAKFVDDTPLPPLPPLPVVPGLCPVLAR